jgi:hypothetical protein
MEDLIITLFLFLILGLMGLIGFIVSNKDILGKYRLNKRKERLNWKKLGGWYLKLQGFILFCKIGNPKLSWLLAFSIPLTLISLILVHYFFLYHSPHDMEEEYGDDYDAFKKQVERDRKINNILK